jgi:uncharacterized protein YjbI with pentapeptide repeats
MRIWRGWTTRDLVIGARSRPARFAGWTVAAILALAAATAYGVALWRAPGWVHATTPQDRYNARVLVISVGGAIVVGTGLFYTARNYRLSQRGQVTDRFTKALERLGSTELYVRIGGVHALKHVMRDSPYHHDDVIEVLTQFIRGRVPLARQPDRQRWMQPVLVGDPGLPPEPTPDVQAALTALAYRPFRPERQRINLGHLHLRGLRLDDAYLTRALLGGADLTGAYLPGADLAGADLTGADLTRAFLTGADLTSARLTGAHLTGAALLGVTLLGASFRDAYLTGAYLGLANLTRADLTGADLTDPDRNLFGADLTGATLGPDPRWMPSGWIVTDPKTGELGRPAGSLSAAWLTGAAGPVSPQRGIAAPHQAPNWQVSSERCHLVGSLNLNSAAFGRVLFR